MHAYAAYSTPKYSRGFSHFEYVNPDAPKGGTLVLGNPDRRSSFDKFNPFTVRGNAPAGLSIFMFESLTALSGDEPQTMYGLLAEEMLVEPDLSSVSFRLHPQATLQQRRAGHRTRREALVRHADRQARFAALPKRVRRGRARP